MSGTDHEAGFSLIELLVIVLILGILTTVVVPRFTGSRERAYDAAAKSELRNAMSAQEAYYTDNKIYTTEWGPAGLDLTAPPEVTVEIPSAGATGYMMTAQHRSSPNAYCVNASVGKIVSITPC